MGCLISASAQPVIPGWDGTMAGFNHAANVDFDSIPGSLEISQFEIRNLLPHPIPPLDGLLIFPVFDCTATVLRFNQVPTSIFFDKENLHSFNVYPVTVDFSTLALSTRDDSPWIFGALAAARLATDFRHVDSDHFSFRLAGGAGYRFDNGFTFGIGGAVGNPDGDMRFRPGIGLDWMINHQFRIGVCGPAWIASFIPDENWQLSVRGDSSGEFWHISDNAGEPLAINLSSYRIGIFASRHLPGRLWLRAGAGVVIANEFELIGSSGNTIVRQGMDGGMFGQIILTIGSW